MSVETNTNYDDILDIIGNNVVSPAVNNGLYAYKAYIVGNDLLHIMLDLTTKTLNIIRHDGKGKKYNEIKDEKFIADVFETCEQQIENQNERLKQEQESIHSITQHEKTLEQVKYIASCPESVLSVENVPGSQNKHGVACVKHFTYSTKNTQIRYSKWIVECFDSAKHMQLHGYEKHDKIVQGSGVNFVRKKNNKIYTFYGNQAMDIIKICESIHREEILRLTNNLQR